MTPNEKGRFCQICSKTVRDFSKLSDLEIIESLDDNSNICANINSNQLNRNLSHSFINSLFSKFAVGFVLTSVGFVEINAQQLDLKKDTVIAKQIRGEVSSNSVIKNDTLKKPVIIRLGGVQSIKENDPPLYILDGKLIDDYTFKKIDTNAIEKIEVLKGLSATALFGSKGQNGAIVITTKKRLAPPKSKIIRPKD
ncbi:MAG: TonB-dependent receptor plug domain-containing protein [Kaistella sp.]